MAHEINNPLAGLLGTIQLVLLRGKETDPLTQQLKDMEKEALRKLRHPNFAGHLRQYLN